jgi:hypothetical protein
MKKYRKELSRMNDISISAAIGALNELSERKTINGHYKIILREIAEYMEQQLTNGWIPVSERLPEFNSIYFLVTTQGKYAVDRAWFLNGKWFYVNSTREREDIIAWQPLPEPYKEVPDDRSN